MGRPSESCVWAYLDEHCAECVTLDGLCGRFYISRHYLAHSFKDQLGVTIGDHLFSLRVSDKTVEQIGYEVGIGAPSYFSRVFKRVEGVSPSEYRRRW